VEEQNMTEQEIFDIVAAHLIRQGRQSMDPAFGCAYRAPNGDKCAVGCLLNDDEINYAIEGRFVTSIHLPARLQPHRWFLRWLQLLHDEVRNWSDIKFWLRDFALTHKLDPLVVDLAQRREPLYPTPAERELEPA
jgi:hypothetical protein